MVRGSCVGVILIPVYMAAAFCPRWPILPPTRTSKAWWEVKISLLGRKFGIFFFPFNLCSYSACDVESQGGNFNILSICIYEL